MLGMGTTARRYVRLRNSCPFASGHLTYLAGFSGCVVFRLIFHMLNAGLEYKYPRQCIDLVSSLTRGSASLLKALG